MKRRSNPWLFFILTLLVVAVGGGIMEYMRRTEQAKVDELDTQIREARSKIQSLAAREAKLKVNEARRKDIETRLLDAKAGNIYAQDLMAMVRASRATATQLPQVSFNARDAGSVAAMGIGTTVTGTETQLLEFIRLLENGRPVTQVNNISWAIPIENGTSGGSGSVTLSLTLYGPLRLPQAPPPAPPAPAKQP
ncbi:MAG: hypothetical protein ACOY93_13670 [Bacillota bacterium]